MQPLIAVENLVKRYNARGLRSQRDSVHALHDVTFSIAAAKTLALVGESGSGKSTLALCLASLERPTSGRILLEGRDVAALDEKELRAVRPQIQLVFQDPASSLNPRFTVLEILTEPLLCQRIARRSEATERAYALLERVGLRAEIARHGSGELSGGQRQRLAIARALIVSPKLLILDEALSALDCSVQAQIANLLIDLQLSLGLAYLFITHDLAMAAHLGDEIAVLDCGRIVERGAPEMILLDPEQRATKLLVHSAPRSTGLPRLRRVS